MALLLLLVLFLVILWVSSGGDIRKKLDIDKPREVCSCPLPLLQSIMADIDVKGKTFLKGKTYIDIIMKAMPV